MADTLADGEFWLPPKFLNDDDDDDIFFADNPFEFPLTSETESSDEDEYMPRFTTQMATSGLHTTDGCKQSSGSRGSPNGHFPQPTFDLLCAAAGKVSKIHGDEHAHHFVNSRPHPKPDPATAAVYQRLQATHFLHLRKQQMIEQMKSAAIVKQNKGCSVRNPLPQMPHNGGRNGEFFKPNWVPPRKHTPPNGSGMRAVFLGASGGKRECAGTGVFLPRQVGKKPACSTVLVPARVMQALNLNLDDMYVQQRIQTRSPPTTFNSANNDVSVRIRSENLAVQSKANLRATMPLQLNHEIRLPQEWAY